MVRRSSLLASIALLGAVFALAGCGSDTTTTTSAGATWADGVCSAVETFRAKVVAAKDSVKDKGPTEENIKAAATSVRDATDHLVADLEDLGPPKTTGGDEIQQTLDTLGSQLEADAKAVSDATSGSNSTLEAISAVSATLLKAQGEIATAADKLRAADVQGELKDAFDNAPACVALKEDTKS